ncbi:uncharacterized protein L201_004935 [Kwoniella dendrophila CBS 6074]|uniref:Uncharacterized protein n=1 Tax=Kwoniella dendrophila CBS 6074 TaxID=1295534 RepID=A0AAX4JZJ4_9TREE
MQTSLSTIPIPLTVDSSSSLHRRRPSLTLSPHFAGSHPVLIPSRHGTISNRSPRSANETGALSTSPSLRRQSRGSFGSTSHSLSGSLTLGSAFLSRSSGVFDDDEQDEDFEKDDGGWLEHTAEDILRADEETVLLLSSGTYYLLIEPNSDGQSPEFFDYADLNTFLLLVLDAKSNNPESANAKYREAVDCLRRGDSVNVGTMCNISGKNPCHLISQDTPLRSFIRLFSTGVHRVAIEGGGVLSHDMVLRYLVSLSEDQIPSVLQSQIASKAFRLSLKPLISISSTATILDAMHIMNRDGLRVLGVLGELNKRSTPNDSSPLLAPTNDTEGGLISVVRAKDCASLVIPSEGKKALTMALSELVKLVEANEVGGKERGEERMPIHTLPPSTTLLYACHLILATSSSRVFVRNDLTPSPLVSPAFEAISSPPLAPAQLSPHCVLSIVDVFKCLVKVYT